MAESAEQTSMSNGTSSDEKVPTLDEKQIDHIVSSWELVKPSMEDSGVVLFIKLFEIAPELQNLFPFAGEDLNGYHEGLKKHARQVMESIDGAVNLLNEPELLKETLLELGIIHNMSNVQVGSFAPVGEALLYALEKGLKEKFTDDVKGSWVALYSAVQYYMTMGMVEGLDAD